MNSETLRVAIAQFTPKWLDKQGTLEVIKEAISNAAEQKADLLVFAEAFWPGYPLWLA